MEKKPTKKTYKQHAPILIDSSEHSDSTQLESPKKPKKNSKAIPSISTTEYQGDLNKTFTKDLSKDEIKALLDGYKKVEPHELQKGFNIRYFIKDESTGEMLFRTGGMITLINEEKNYIVVSGGRTFSVQLKPTTIFFQQQPISEIVRDLKEDFELVREKLDDKIEKLEKENVILMKHNKMFTKEITKKDKQIAKLEETIKKLQKK
jgi:RNA recognition motif-containing protein